MSPSPKASRHWLDNAADLPGSDQWLDAAGHAPNAAEKRVAQSSDPAADFYPRYGAQVARLDWMADTA